MDTEKILPCADKLAFDTQAEARAVAATSVYRRGSKYGFHVYKCAYCYLWHLATGRVED